MTRKLGLRNILRIDDLDPKAVPEGCLEGQYADLDWLGLVFDECPRVGGPVGPYQQSQRFEQYDQVLRQLDEEGLLYPCYCSRKEVRMAALAPHASDEGPVYAGTCRPKSPQVNGDFDALPSRNGRRPAMRLNVGEAMRRLGCTRLTYDDLIAGPQSFALTDAVGDFVVRRVDGIAAYQVACAWDDVAMGCSMILRGSDLLPSAARQLLLMRTLSWKEPRFAHVGLVLSKAGERLSKRDGATAIEELRADGTSPEYVIKALAEMSGLPSTSDLDFLTEAVSMRTLKQSDVQSPW